MSNKWMTLTAGFVVALVGWPRVRADTPPADGAPGPIAPWRATDIDALRAGFAAPPREAGPWVFWFFFDNVMSKGEITRELEEMAAAGIAGVELRFVSMRGFAEGRPGPCFDPEAWRRLGQERLEFLSPEFVDALTHACDEARRLGLQVAIGTGMGWPAGGPWVTPQHRSKHLAWTSREIDGPAVFADEGLPPHSMVLAWRLDPEAAGKTVAPEIDPGSREAVLFHLEHVFSRLDPGLGRFYGTTLVDVTTDSWEYERGGNRFWTPGIVDAFVRANGYDLRERMHALLG